MRPITSDEHSGTEGRLAPSKGTDCLMSHDFRMLAVLGANRVAHHQAPDPARETNTAKPLTFQKM